MRMIKTGITSLGIALLLFWSCTPKTTQQVQSAPAPEPAKPVVSSKPCATFKDSKAGEAALDAHVIYRDYLRNDHFKEAIPYWRQAFEAAPAADGQRTTHYDDGIRIYDYLLNQESTKEAKLVYLDSIMYMYDRMQECYPDQYVDGKKAFDLYYNYRSLVSNKRIFDLFTSVIDREGLETPAFVINPFTALLVEMFTSKELDQPTAERYAKTILAITDNHAKAIENASCDLSLNYVRDSDGSCYVMDKDGSRTPADSSCCAVAADIKEGWPIVIGYAPAQLDAFETVKGFYDCAHYKEKYFDNVNLDSVDCDEIPLIRSQLIWGGCAEDDPAIAALMNVVLNRCMESAGQAGPLRCGRDALEEGRYTDAIDCYKEYVAGSEDPEKRAKYNLRIAKIYYGHIRNFPQAREYARLALTDEPKLGDAYLLIGKLYASSGPLCGPGRGWDSQIVTWPAIDMFNKALQVDPGVGSEARRLIREYSRYMPSVEDIFQRQLKEGDTFFVGCWIQESTKIRAAR